MSLGITQPLTTGAVGAIGLAATNSIPVAISGVEAWVRGRVAKFTRPDKPYIDDLTVRPIADNIFKKLPISIASGLFLNTFIGTAAGAYLGYKIADTRHDLQKSGFRKFIGGVMGGVAGAAAGNASGWITGLSTFTGLSLKERSAQVKTSRDIITEDTWGLGSSWENAFDMAKISRKEIPVVQNFLTTSLQFLQEESNPIDDRKKLLNEMKQYLPLPFSGIDDGSIHDYKTGYDLIQYASEGHFRYQEDSGHTSALDITDIVKNAYSLSQDIQFPSSENISSLLGINSSAGVPEWTLNPRILSTVLEDDKVKSQMQDFIISLIPRYSTSLIDEINLVAGSTLRRAPLATNTEVFTVLQSMSGKQLYDTVSPFGTIPGEYQHLIELMIQRETTKNNGALARVINDVATEKLTISKYSPRRSFGTSSQYLDSKIVSDAEAVEEGVDKKSGIWGMISNFREKIGSTNIISLGGVAYSAADLIHNIRDTKEMFSRYFNRGNSQPNQSRTPV